MIIKQKICQYEYQTLSISLRFTRDALNFI